MSNKPRKTRSDCTVASFEKNHGRKCQVFLGNSFDCR